MATLTLFDRIKKKLREKGIEPGSNAARAWIFSKMRELNPTREKLMRGPHLRGSTIVGKMFFYFYNPKTKDKLPRWDRFPLVIPIEMYSDGFLGLNLHYVSASARFGILGALSEYRNNDKYDETTRLRLSYDLLKKASKLQIIEPCIKRYLYSHVESQFVEIQADEWDIAILLPVEKFERK